jgi:hypothetical protein
MSSHRNMFTSELATTSRYIPPWFKLGLRELEAGFWFGFK